MKKNIKNGRSIMVSEMGDAISLYLKNNKPKGMILYMDSKSYKLFDKELKKHFKNVTSSRK